MNYTAIVILILVGILVVFLFYAAVKGFKTYKFKTRYELSDIIKDLDYKAKRIAKKQTAEKRERKRLRKLYGSHGNSDIMDVALGRR